MRENIIKLITLALIVVLGIISYRIFIVPKSKGIKSLRETLSKIERQVNAIFGEEVTLRGGTVQQEEILRQLEKFKEQIPSERDLPRVADEIITRSSRGLDIDYQSIEPQEMVPEGKYKRFPLKIGFTSNYPDFVSYLTQLSQLPVIVVVDNLSLKRMAEGADKLEIALELSAFVVPAQPGEKGAVETKTLPALLVNPFAAETEIEKISAEGMAKTVKKTVPKQPDLSLQGIWKGKEITAFVNGKMVKAGDSVGGYTVQEIQDNKIVLTKNGKQYTLTLK